MPQALVTGVPQLPFSVEYQNRQRALINEFFYVDVFLRFSQMSEQGNQSRMTNDHVAELQGEKAAILGTRIGNLQSEAFDPLITRVFEIEARAGRIPQAPEILTNTVHGPVEIEYLGPLAQAQTRLTKIRSIVSGLQIATQIAQINPTAIDVIDYDVATREALDAEGFPASCMRDPKMIAQIRDQRNKLQERERFSEEFPKVARGAAALSKAPEAGSIVQQVLGGEGAPVQ
jgi:hypothetical protein